MKPTATLVLLIEMHKSCTLRGVKKHLKRERQWSSGEHVSSFTRDTGNVISCILLLVPDVKNVPKQRSAHSPLENLYFLLYFVVFFSSPLLHLLNRSHLFWLWMHTRCTTTAALTVLTDKRYLFLRPQQTGSRSLTEIRFQDWLTWTSGDLSVAIHVTSLVFTSLHSTLPLNRRDSLDKHIRQQVDEASPSSPPHLLVPWLILLLHHWRLNDDQNNCHHRCWCIRYHVHQRSPGSWLQACVLWERRLHGWTLALPRLRWRWNCFGNEIYHHQFI